MITGCGIGCTRPIKPAFYTRCWRLAPGGLTMVGYWKYPARVTKWPVDQLGGSNMTNQYFLSTGNLRLPLRYFALAGAMLASISVVASTHAEQPLRVAFMIGEDEYQMKDTLPAFADSYLKPAGVKCTFI